jgi:hypothetical protein
VPEYVIYSIGEDIVFACVTKVTQLIVLIYEICGMDTTGIIIFSIVILHLLAGFGYVVYKLRPKEKERKL